MTFEAWVVIGVGFLCLVIGWVGGVSSERQSWLVRADGMTAHFCDGKFYCIMTEDRFLREYAPKCAHTPPPGADPTRTGVRIKVSDAEWPTDGMGEPGLLFWACDSSGRRRAAIVGCPGCGALGVMNTEADDPNVLDGDPACMTLATRVSCLRCCGWRGRLINGEFVT